MAKSIFAKTKFNLGEISPRVFGQFGEDKPIYRDGMAMMQNFMIFQAGGAFYRPGTQYIDTAGQVSPVRLQPFQYSITQTYMLEFGNQYLRFYANLGSIASQITTPYLQADLFQLQFAQQDDVNYIANQNYPIYKLIRTSAVSFIIQKVQLIGGPFMSSNIGNVTITASSATGSTTLTATIVAWQTATQYIPGDYVTNSGTTYLCLLTHVSGVFATDLANGNWTAQNFFVAGHVGALWSVGVGTPNATPPEPPGTVVITAFNSATSVSGYVQNNPDGTAGAISTTSATSQWAEGCFSTYRGFPVSCGFHEGRLILGGTFSQPKTIWGSVVGAYEDFSVNTASDSDSWQYTSSIGGFVQWIKSAMVNGAIGLRVGTNLGTLVWLDGSTSGITPSSPPNVISSADYQVQYAQAQQISSFIYYLQGNTYQLRQLVYDLVSGADKSEDTTILADHILRDGGGAIQMSRQQSPNDRLWVVRADGVMAVLTRNVEQQIEGWVQIISGSTSGGNGLFNSVAIIPVSGSDDQVWVSVSRIVNGVRVQFIEVFTSELFNYYYQPVRLDASLHIDNPITISGISNASPGVITATSHGLSNGNRIKIDNVFGMTNQIVNALGQVVTSSLNMNEYLVANSTTNTFTLTDLAGNAINTTSWTIYFSGGQARLMNTTFSNLSYLNGELVTVVADGGLVSGQQEFLVSGGSITLPNYAAVVTVGLQYQGLMQFLPLGEQSGGYISQTKKRKIYKPIGKFWQSAGGQFGYPLNNLFPIILPTQTPNVHPSQFPGLYTGDFEMDLESFFDSSWSPYIVQNVPLPFMILSIVFRSDIEEDK